MKKKILTVFTAACVFFSCAPVFAQQDMRELQIKARMQRQKLENQAKQEKRAAEQEAGQTRQEITKNRKSLKQAIAGLEKETQQQEENIASLEKDMEAFSAREKELDSELAETDRIVSELAGTIKANADDITGLAEGSLQNPLAPGARALLESIAEKRKFPGMEDIRMMAEVLYKQVRLSGNVRVKGGTIIDRSGEESRAGILLIGNFTAAYRTDQETGFLKHSPGSGQLFALSSLPPGGMQRKINDYMDGKSMAVPMDITRGGALRQLTHELSLSEQISEGGPIVWPILFLLGLGLLIIAERTIFLLRRRFDAEGFMRSIKELVKQGRFEKCRQACDGHGTKPLPRVISAGLDCCHMPREEMENALQEAILREIPPMERFLSTLGMLAAIAPLLGLLGTVTGMINTFHVITTHGTGDPRIMSGGISEALVTTMLGLAVAIPMLMAHTWLNRAVEKDIGEMEQNAVALVNMAHKSRGGHEHNSGENRQK
ncbi:biopolymer transport protein ExbB [Desulfosalsimonas propionicica]|uniref:Biopolymer transport protein ExbB n=1 Tax=Desulfosalsimonas propionicica TaxID=332175 RepID=A0A7W0HLD8_9BACT|nr:MotA/TolQ/ExbB proton channel family protein [Desulfosalsimonas propionicica]MBA2882198.1 biopolymer transport protein ExbB [Desulfosalsimonas propionicica]